MLALRCPLGMHISNFSEEIGVIRRVYAALPTILCTELVHIDGLRVDHMLWFKCSAQNECSSVNMCHAF